MWLLKRIYMTSNVGRSVKHGCRVGVDNVRRRRDR